MVQRSRVIEVLLVIISRLFLFALSVGLGLYFFSTQVHDFVVNTLGYQQPSGFFGFTFADWTITWIMSTSFWMGVIFGIIGRRIDYVIIIILFALFSIDYARADDMTWLVYSGLVGATVIGNMIGFALKLLRQKYWK